MVGAPQCSTIVLAGSLSLQGHTFLASKVRIDVAVDPCERDCTDLEVQSIVITGSCGCNGHAETCWSAERGEERTCQCEHNTDGRYCERCLPMYNNRPYQVGTAVSGNACEVCNCNNHQSENGSCQYNAVLGYGVCDVCVDNTHGTNCQHCLDTFYRSTEVPVTDAKTCVPCQCGLGSLNESCQQEQVRDEAMAPGQCYCKQNTRGRQCHECKDGYYGTLPSCRMWLVRFAGDVDLPMQ